VGFEPEDGAVLFEGSDKGHIPSMLLDSAVAHAINNDNCHARHLNSGNLV
jgi:hypothetical protein